MSLVVLISFEHFFKKMIDRFQEYKIEHIIVHFEDLDHFLKTNRQRIKIFIISGSTQRILRDGLHPNIDKILKMPVPVIGLCYGFQYMAMQSGGVLEDGTIRHKIVNQEGVVNYMGNKETIPMWFNHFDKVSSLPVNRVVPTAEYKVLWKIDSRVDGMIVMAHTDKWIGFQFHPEYKKKQFEKYILPLVKDLPK